MESVPGLWSAGHPCNRIERRCSWRPKSKWPLPIQHLPHAQATEGVLSLQPKQLHTSWGCGLHQSLSAALGTRSKRLSLGGQGSIGLGFSCPAGPSQCTYLPHLLTP